MNTTLYHWIFFCALIGLLLGMDLWKTYRHPHAIAVREALYTSAGWILLALGFNGWIYFTFGSEPALNFLAGYLVEKSLSIDNLFIFLLIFARFKVPETSKHQVLFYGLLGAVVMRALLIWGGIALVTYFRWVFFVFGLFLIYTGVQLALKKEEEQSLEHNLAYRWILKRLRVIPEYYEGAFFIQKDKQWFATPLFASLLLIETTDLVFALDSVPAILGITTDPFIAFTSNIFAILGLRSLFFALEGMMKQFHLIHYALASILVFIGLKMVIADSVHIPTWFTLLFITSALTTAIYYSAKEGSSRHTQ